MNLAVDIGNSRVKAAVFRDRELVSRFAFAHGDETAFVEWLSAFGEYDYSIVSSVVEENGSVTMHLNPSQGGFHMDDSLSVPFTIVYETPATLGHDRLANAAGAIASCPSEPVLVVDAGTCLKTDWINNKGAYGGGSISPGLHMRLGALHTFTGKLPLIEATQPRSITGLNTHESMLSGVVNGMTFEIEGFVEHYRASYPGLKVILTGGDAPFFEKRLKSSIFVAPNLALQGLNEILLFNAQKP